LQVIEQHQPNRLLEPAGVTNEVAVVGEVRVDRRSHDLGEVLNLRERVLEVNDRQHRDERGQFNLVERLHLLVSVQQRVDGVDRNSVSW
jgi:hypothetical protein